MFKAIILKIPRRIMKKEYQDSYLQVENDLHDLNERLYNLIRLLDNGETLVLKITRAAEIDPEGEIKFKGGKIY